MSKSNSERGSNPHLFKGRLRRKRSRNATPLKLTREHLAGMPIPLTGTATQPSSFRAPPRTQMAPLPSANAATADAPGVRDWWRGIPAVERCEEDDGANEIGHQGDLFEEVGANASSAPETLDTGVEEDQQPGCEAQAGVPTLDRFRVVDAVLSEFPAVLREVLDEVIRRGGEPKRHWLLLLAAAESCASSRDLVQSERGGAEASQRQVTPPGSRRR
jgi:hypothetical protein